MSKIRERERKQTDILGGATESERLLTISLSTNAGDANLGETKIRNFHMPFRIEKDILWLEITERISEEEHE